jgi:hypothetical protein
MPYQRVLHKVLCFRQIPGRGGEATRSPSHEPRPVPLHQRVERGRVTGLNAVQQIERRLGS